MIPEALQAHLTERAQQDQAFCQVLLSDPRAVLAWEYHVHLPEQVVVRVREDAPGTFTLVLEETPVELTEADLQAITGGGGGVDQAARLTRENPTGSTAF